MSPSWLTANVQTVLQRLGKDPDFNAYVLPYMDDLMLMVQEGTDIVVQQRALVERFIEDGFPVATSKTVWYNQEGKAKILGVPWYGGATDCIGVSFKSPKVEPTTRRSVLSMVNGLYDPLGLLLEQEMSGRLLVRDTINYAWDERLPQDLCERASKWLVATKKIVDTYKIPRLIDCTKLLVYVDASMDAWGVDIRTTNGQRVISQGGLFPAD
ncbi:hypothetical protein FOZ60_012469 [Perkinsus olseni]|uniref:Reverse transcriptase domain-containing protein n=1 Tax=Perkinsus olseni TaxID=32597 RepID=A0A7J6NBC8_PEROL|nr:hypothetical protein FOZ60_012469 [Perkinsus olseni]